MVAGIAFDMTVHGHSFGDAFVGNLSGFGIGGLTGAGGKAVSNVAGSRIEIGRLERTWTSERR